jgi:hypothetical protein
MDKKNINLLQKRGAPPTVWERMYDWVTNTCRIIVIVTELFVLIAFGWRFWLDRTLNDLKGEIETNGDILKNLSDQEDNIRLLQDKLTAYSDIWSKSSNISPVLKEVNGYIPSGINQLSVGIQTGKEGKTLAVQGETSRDQVSKLENALKDSKSFTDVSLATIEKKGEGTDMYNFSITAKVIFSKERSLFTSNNGTAESTTQGTF